MLVLRMPNRRFSSFRSLMVLDIRLKVLSPPIDDRFVELPLLSVLAGTEPLRVFRVVDIVASTVLHRLPLVPASGWYVAKVLPLLPLGMGTLGAAVFSVLLLLDSLAET